jgi:hypothetical protein
MAIYGYDASASDATQPSRLSEVTFQLSSTDVRRVASFLLASADEIDTCSFADGGRHLRDLDRQWQAEHPDDDVIVVPASPRTQVGK